MPMTDMQYHKAKRVSRPASVNLVHRVPRVQPRYQHTFIQPSLTKVTLACFRAKTEDLSMHGGTEDGERRGIRIGVQFNALIERF